MKKLLRLILLLINPLTLHSQGLENIIVEKYYVSDMNDASVNASGGVLPVGSVTYRIYVDMLPGYRFQAGYGVPGHDLRIETTTLFFNNEDRGATTPTYTKNQAKNNTVMLDSWLSVGAACSGNFGVLKSSDDGVGTVVNAEIPPVLQNADTTAGIPISQQDGMIAGSPEDVTIVGINSEIAMFDNQNDGTNGPLFFTDNGSWASLNGSVGPDSMENKVLIAQITTDGDFSFELNIQIGTPGGGVEQYVARNPVGAEIEFPALIYSSLTADVREKSITKSDFSIFPNPVKNFVNVNLPSSIQKDESYYFVYDMYGRTIMNGKITTGEWRPVYSIPCADFASGNYLMEIISNGQKLNSRFSIQE